MGEDRIANSLNEDFLWAHCGTALFQALGIGGHIREGPHYPREDVLMG